MDFNTPFTFIKKPESIFYESIPNFDNDSDFKQLQSLYKEIRFQWIYFFDTIRVIISFLLGPLLLGLIIKGLFMGEYKNNTVGLIVGLVLSVSCSIAFWLFWNRFLLHFKVRTKINHLLKNPKRFYITAGIISRKTSIFTYNDVAIEYARGFYWKEKNKKEKEFSSLLFDYYLLLKIKKDGIVYIAESITKEEEPFLIGIKASIEEFYKEKEELLNRKNEKGANWREIVQTLDL
jgi:hypothetical protein